MRISYNCFDCGKTYKVSPLVARTANLNHTFVSCPHCEDGGNDPYDYIETPAMEALGTDHIDSLIDPSPNLRSVLRNI